MNILSAIQRHQRSLYAGYLLRIRHEKTAPYPKAERRFWQVCAVLFVAVVAIHLAPDDEYVLFIRLFIFNLFGFGLIVCMAAVAVLISAGTIGQAVVEAYKSGSRTAKELAALPAPDAAPAVEAGDGKMLPTLTPFDVARIENAINPRLNLETAAKVKPWIAAGYTIQETADRTGLAPDTVKKYSAVFRKGIPAPLSVENESENEVHCTNAL